MIAVETSSPGNRWEYSGRNKIFSPDGVLTVVDNPQGVLRDVVDGIQQHFVQPHWSLESVMGNPGYMAVIFTHPDLTKVSKEIPDPRVFIREERFNEPPFYYDSKALAFPKVNGWFLSEDRINELLGVHQTNLQCAGHFSAWYNEIAEYSDYHGQTVIKSYVNQAGVGLIVARLRPSQRQVPWPEELFTDQLHLFH